MRGLMLLLIIALLMPSGMLNCFCAAVEGTGILSDLTLLEQLESKQLADSIRNYSRELEYQYNEAVRITRKLDVYGNSAEASGLPVMPHEVLYLLGYVRGDVGDNSLLFRDKIFLDYYSVRTAKLLEGYKKSGKMDLVSFTRGSRQEFDKYISEVQGDGSRGDRAVLLLQDKLAAKLYSDDIENKGAYLDQLLALRLPANKDNRNRSLYELMESRVRLKLLEELAGIEKSTLRAYLADTKVFVNCEFGGVLSFQYISEIENRTLSDYSLYVAAGNSDYKPVLSLGRIAAIQGKAAFTGRDGQVRLMSRDSIWGKLHMGAQGLEVNLTEVNAGESQPYYDVFSNIPVKDQTADIKKLQEIGKSMENRSKEAFKHAMEITKSLNALDSYSALKARGVSNAYTAKFEAGRGAWLSELTARLNSMNRLTAGQKVPDAGYVGFLGYIRGYIDYSRECTRLGLTQSSPVLVFRDTVLQFRTVDEGALWIWDMLFKLKYLK